jgi:hypothetical protein
MKTFAGMAALVATVAFAAAEEKAPPPSAGHDLVYHDELQRVLLVNAGLGSDRGPYRVTDKTKLWGFDGKAWRVVDDAGPPVRNLGGVAYDSDRKKLVLHGGGYDLDHSYADTWEWDAKGADAKGADAKKDAKEPKWKKFEGKGPGVRDHSRMVYDPVRKLTVLFGGQIDLQHFPRDVWLYDGKEWKREDPTGGPGSRVHHAMAFDPDLKGIVVAAGYEPGVADRADAWLLDAKGWHALPALKEPRTHARMGFDPGVGLVLVGGMEASTRVVTLGKSGWSPLEAPPELARRYLCALAFDADRETLVLFGGGDPAGSDLFADTWESDGKAWRKLDAKH